MNTSERRFSVCASERDPHAGRLVAAVSFEAAAIAYAEAAHPGAGADLRLIVCDLETGAERCFLLDLAVAGADAGPV